MSLKEKQKKLLLAHHELNNNKAKKLYEKYIEKIKQSNELIDESQKWLDYYDLEIQIRDEKIKNLKVFQLNEFILIIGIYLE